VVVQVRLGIVVPTQGTHDKEAALGTILFQQQASVLEHLKTESGWGLVQCNYVHGLSQRVFQNGPNLQRTGEHVCSRQFSHEEYGNVDVAQDMGLLPGG
jgi:hypothetical protein